MLSNSYALIFTAGVLTGVGAATLALITPEFVLAVRHLTHHLRSRQRRGGETG